MREEPHRADMPCHSTCKRTALCPLSPRLTWGELTLRSITSPWCFMTGWAWAGGLRRAIVNMGAADPHFLPLWLARQIPLGNRSVKSSDGSRKDVITFTGESSHCTGVSSLWLIHKWVISLNEVTASGYTLPGCTSLASCRTFTWQPFDFSLIITHNVHRFTNTPSTNYTPYPWNQGCGTLGWTLSSSYFPPLIWFMLVCSVVFVVKHAGIQI